MLEWKKKFKFLNKHEVCIAHVGIFLMNDIWKNLIWMIRLID